MTTVKKKILVVDDEASMTWMLRRNLESTGKYEVRTENSGNAAAVAAREFHPDFILLDVMMPGVDGGEVAARLKEDKALQNIPVVFLTAIVKQEETAPTGGTIGGCEYLAKPVKLEDLVACIEKHLGKA
jgi:two-component system, OmpR family, response regulator